MSLRAAIAKWNYSVENAGAGRLLYREGNREFIFPFYKEDGSWVLAAAPSAQRIYFFFSWQAELPEFSDEMKKRILPRIEGQLRARGFQVRIFEPVGMEGGGFEFYAELLEQREHAVERLAAAGFNGFADYSSIDVMSAEYGLEICGIKNERSAQLMAAVLQRCFPHWHHQDICRYDDEPEAGWTLALCLFPARSGNPEWSEEE